MGELIGRYGMVIHEFCVELEIVVCCCAENY